jgi:NADH-quinone oxidoreductase subunit H
MIESVDQVFVTLKHGIVMWFPESVRPVVSAFCSIAPITAIFPLLFAITTILERKGLGRIQNRYGPNRVGPYGLFQPIADGIKMLIKEDIVPRAADRVVHFLAPVALLVPVLLSFSVLPYGRNMAPIELDAGLLFFFAVGAATELAVFMAGWSSRNKYSLLGAMRAIAQMISYEVPLVLSTIPVVMLAGTLSLVTIVNQQAAFVHGIASWNLFTPWGVAGFLLFLVAATAESNRTPFDIPEAESEIIAGYLTEYSGFKYALFFLGEYLGLFALSSLGVTLFLGGWSAPFAFLDWIPSWLWFFVKLIGMIFFFIWTRGTLPRLRVDQLLRFSWKFMLPLCLANLLMTAVWEYSRTWGIPGAVVVRWTVCLLLVAVPYVVLGRAIGPKVSKRTYRFAA